jgi:hypothetical protein
MLGRKEKTFVLVKDRRDAEVTLEVMGRELVPTGETIVDALGRRVLTPDVTATVWVKLTVDEYSTGIAGRGGNKGGAWTAAARDVAHQVERWVQDHGARIPRK